MLPIVIVIAIEHLADAFYSPGIGLPVVEHTRPAGDVRDGIGDGSDLAVGR